MISLIAAAVDRALERGAVRVPRWLRLGLQGAAVLTCACAFVLVMFLMFVYSETHWVPDRQMALMGIFTVVVFGEVTFEFRRCWKRWRFWLALFGLFAAHVLAYAVLWRRGLDWRSIHYAALALMEIPMVSTALDKLGFAPGSVRRRRHSPLGE